MVRSAAERLGSASRDAAAPGTDGSRHAGPSLPGARRRGRIVVDDAQTRGRGDVASRARLDRLFFRSCAPESAHGADGMAEFRPAPSSECRPRGPLAVGVTSAETRTGASGAGWVGRARITGRRQRGGGRIWVRVRMLARRARTRPADTDWRLRPASSLDQVGPAAGTVPNELWPLGRAARPPCTALPAPPSRRGLQGCSQGSCKRLAARSHRAGRT
jgi:hypothetical protein